MPTKPTQLIDLALQGGGSHGAFTWGVCERFLEEPRIDIDSITGTSAGAMNAAVLADGHAAGGAEGARAALEAFWRRVSDAAMLSPFRRGPLDVLLGRWTLDSSPIYLALDLALQGGGSHGAFTWGVLDRLLEEPWLHIEAISGTSAGAMNGAVMVAAHADGGAAAARAALEAFWRRVSEAAAFSPLQRSPMDRMLGRWSLDRSPVYLAFDFMARVFSPYDFAFGALNPLAKVLSDSVDFTRLAGAPIKLFITATNVRTGRPRVFRNAEMSPDVLLASACLPTMFQAVEIDGEAYWDGGYSGNPTMTPLVQECVSDDTIIVGINPVERPGIPKSARDILNRLNEVSFNAVLLKELRMMALLRRVASADDEEVAHWSRMRMHLIRSEMMVTLDSSSKLNAEWAFLTLLRDEGRRCADAFLAAHGADLGTRSTLDIDLLLDGV
jgi:NTE family protein